MQTYLQYGLSVSVCFIIFCVMDHVMGRRIKFGYNLFYCLWLSFAYSLFAKGFVITGLLLWVASLFCSCFIYNTLFIRRVKTKE